MIGHKLEFYSLWELLNFMFFIYNRIFSYSLRITHGSKTDYGKYTDWIGMLLLVVSTLL